MKKILVFVIAFNLWSCSTFEQEPLRQPAMEYANKVKQQYAAAQAPRAQLVGHNDPVRARLSLVGDQQEASSEEAAPSEPQDSEIVSNLGSEGSQHDKGYAVYESSNPAIRDYNGPLSLGDPGLNASLWKETRAGNALFRDYRAWQPMDLITIVVTENTEGKKEADTNVTQESTIEAAINNFLGWEKSERLNSRIDLTNLINATSSHDYKGEADTSRKGSLKARLSAMVVEVLPTGILRIEGEKIVSVNSEDETMIISGLVRPEDVNSSNEIDSSKVANVRIDYFGKGTVGDAQKAGWMGRIIRNLWPF